MAMGRPGPPPPAALLSMSPPDIEGVRVQMEPSSPLNEGDSVRLNCSAHSPVDLDFQWRDEKVSGTRAPPRGGFSPFRLLASLWEVPWGGLGGSAPWIVPPQQGRKVAEGNQLVLRNLTFETSSNFSCQAVARSVPGLERSKQVAVAVQGKE